MLESRYAAKSEIIEAIRSSWDELPETSHKEMDRCRDEGRP
ncbi:hypothetical protein [Endozoicomonas sp. 4G]|nr:hypothetical protein [Endozoicomonas sp. 4G]